jgi:hypothetical protein
MKKRIKNQSAAFGSSRPSEMQKEHPAETFGMQITQEMVGEMAKGEGRMAT